MIDSSSLATFTRSDRTLQFVDMLISCVQQIANESKNLKTQKEVFNACKLYKNITRNLCSTTIKNIIAEGKKINANKDFFFLIDKIRRILLAMDKIVFEKVENSNPEIGFFHDVAASHITSWSLYVVKIAEMAREYIED